MRQEAAAPHLDPGDRVQGLGLVQDGQPAGREELGLGQRERGQEERHQGRCEERQQERHQERHKDREEVRDKGGGQAGAEERRGILTTVRALVRDARAVATSFFDDECPFLAGAVAFQIFFATIPLLALIVGVLGFIYGSERAQQELVELIRDIYPSATAQETRIARQLVDGRAISLGIGIVGTLLATGAIHSSLDKVLAAVLGTGGKRGFVRGNAEAFAFVAGIALLAVVSIAVSYAALAAEGALVAAGLGGATRALLWLVSPFLGLAAGLVLFYCIYSFVPRSRVRPQTARVAALVSAVLWEIAKLVFGVFTRSLGIFSVYGPIAFAAALLTWIYVTAMIILIGAEVIKLKRA
ncbi:MAG: YihY/virulence factor BrkB family protein [Chloroflexota bacterium]|nr:YihY/virulence factor BrkB family protein [Chloroflexota bacterium]